MVLVSFVLALSISSSESVVVEFVVAVVLPSLSFFSLNRLTLGAVEESVADVVVFLGEGGAPSCLARLGPPYYQKKKKKLNKRIFW